MKIEFDTDTANFGELTGLFRMVESILDNQNPEMSYATLEEIYLARKNRRRVNC